MNLRNSKVTARSAPGTRFEVPAPFRTEQEGEFSRLKNRLLLRLLNETDDPVLAKGLRNAANEAEALAWVTAYPALVYPVLFEEKAETARTRTERQNRIRRRSRALLVEAV